MLRSRLAAWMVFAGVLLVLTSVGLLSSVVADWEQANGSRRLQKLTVNVDRSAASPGTAGLKLKDAGQLAQKWSPLPVAYSAAAQTRAGYGNVSTNSDVFGVNGNYRDFAGIKMKTGTFISQKSIDEHSRVAVIGLQLADRLFRSGQIAGKTIELFGVAFTVIGVFDDEGSLLRQMSDDGIPDVLIPVTAMIDINPATLIDTVQLAAKPDAAIRGEAEVKDTLRAIGQNPALYRIDNGVLAYTRITQLKSILLFGCGSIAIFLLARLTIRQFTIVRMALQSRFAVYDWPDALRSERYRLMKFSLITVGMAACAAALWELIRFRLYIPPDWVPDEIIDLPFYMDKLRSLWQQQAAQAGYVPSPQELLADSAGLLAVRLFFIGALCGLPLFLLGIRLWTFGRVPAYVQLQQLFLYMPVASVAAFAAARWAGTDYRIDPLDYAVPGALFIISIVYLNHSKGVKFPYAQSHS